MHSVQHSAWHILGRQHMVSHSGHAVYSDEGLTSYCIPRGTAVKNPPASAGDTGDVGLIPGLGRSSREGNHSHPSILAWKIP